MIGGWNQVSTLPNQFQLSVKKPTRVGGPRLHQCLGSENFMWPLILAFHPPVTDEACRTILTPIDLMKGKPLEEFYLTVPEHVSRFISRHKDPLYTSLGFKSDGEYGEEWDWGDQ
jgi:hypothetical protein